MALSKNSNEPSKQWGALDVFTYPVRDLKRLTSQQASVLPYKMSKGIKSSLNSVRESSNTISAHWYEQREHLQRGAKCVWLVRGDALVISLSWCMRSFRSYFPPTHMSQSQRISVCVATSARQEHENSPSVNHPGSLLSVFYKGEKLLFSMNELKGYYYTSGGALFVNEPADEKTNNTGNTTKRKEI